jgi:hypothetical protein
MINDGLSVYSTRLKTLRTYIFYITVQHLGNDYLSI